LRESHIKVLNSIANEEFTNHASELSVFQHILAEESGDKASNLGL
jgi:hypothetical protein